MIFNLKTPEIGLKFKDVLLSSPVKHQPFSGDKQFWFFFITKQIRCNGQVEYRQMIKFLKHRSSRIQIAKQAPLILIKLLWIISCVKQFAVQVQMIIWGQACSVCNVIIRSQYWIYWTSITLFQLSMYVHSCQWFIVEHTSLQFSYKLKPYDHDGFYIFTR